MPSLDKPETGASPPPAVSAPWRVPPVHPDGRKFMVAAGALAFFFWWVVDWDTAGWLTAFATVWIAIFFRDPVRTTPTAAGLVVAPADGTVTTIAAVAPPRELAGAEGLGNDPLVRVSIYLSPFDSHIIRAPIDGAVRRQVYVAGRFVNPTLNKASTDNERQHMLLEKPGGVRVGFTQIAGIIGRRIVSTVASGDTVVAGQRVGLIRFGSRVDIFLPAGTGSAVLLGQRTIAGETVIARIGESLPLEGVAQ